MSLFRYYRKAVFYPSLFVLLFSVVYSILDNSKGEGSTAKSAIVISIVTSAVYCLLMCGSSLTIFLNKIQKLNRNLVWNISTWFLLPFGYMSMVLVHDISNRINYEFGFGKGFIYLLIMTLPFVFGLAWTFLKYKQDQTSASTN